MAILDENGTVPYIINVQQDTAYEFRFVKPFTGILDEIDFKCDFYDESKVRYSISYSFDDLNYSPYNTDFNEVFSFINQHMNTGGFDKVYIKTKLTFDFHDEHDFYRLYAIHINGRPVMPTDIKFTEIQNYRGITNSYTKNLLKPYENLDSSIDRMLAQANKISEMFGHEVYYIKVKEIEESFNSTFKTFEKFKADLIKKVKVLVPDNDFKANTLVYAEFDIEYQEDLRIHIVLEEFEKAFGFGSSPQAKDIVYIPQIGRMYDVVSSTSILQLGLVPVFQNCALRKHVATTDVSTESVTNPDGFDVNSVLTFEINEFEDGLTETEFSNDNNDPLLQIDDDNAQRSGKLISDANVEGVDAQSLQDYYYLEKHEVTRKYTHVLLSVVNQPLKVNSAPIFFRYYNAQDIRGIEIAVQYNRVKMITPSKIFNISMWFKSDSQKHTILKFYSMIVQRNESRIEIIDTVKNEVISYIDGYDEDFWSFLNINIDLNTMNLNFSVYKYDQIDVEFSSIGEEFAKLSLIKINKYLDNFYVYGGMLFSNVKIYAKAFEGDNVTPLALDRNISIQDSIIIDTVFDIKQAK